VGGVGVLAVRGGRLARITLRGFGDAVPMANDAVLVGVLLESTACSDAMVPTSSSVVEVGYVSPPCRFIRKIFLSSHIGPIPLP